MRWPRPSWPKGLDPWDLVGAGGIGLVAGGVWRLAGWPWASILVGAVLFGVYVMVARARAGKEIRG